MTSDSNDSVSSIVSDPAQPVLQPATLPWHELPKIQQSSVDDNPKLGIYKVVGPYGLSALVVSLHGSTAIDTVSHDGSTWRVMDVWPDNCSAELLGSSNIDSKLWQHFLIDQGLSVTGMVFQ